MRNITGIIVHCTATRANWREGDSTAAKVAEVKRWHTQGGGWSDIGYHYLVDRDGTIAEGRPIWRDGAHVRGHNIGTIGIALFGGHGSSENDNFADNFTAAQDKALRGLIATLQGRYGPVEVTGHNQYAAKACPGFNAPEWLASTPQRTDPDHAAAMKLADSGLSLVREGGDLTQRGIAMIAEAREMLGQ